MARYLLLITAIGLHACSFKAPDISGNGGSTPDSGPASSDSGMATPDSGVAGCVPGNLTLTSDSPVSPCNTVTITLNLDGCAGEAARVNCTAGRTNVQGPARFTNDSSGGWDVVSGASEVDFRDWPDGFPTPSCDQGGRYVRFREGSSSFITRSSPVDTRGYRNLSADFRLGYRDSPNAGNDLELSGCCSSGCTRQNVGSIPNAASGGKNECDNYTLTLPAFADNCQELELRFNWPNSNGRAGIDDLAISGDPIVNAINDLGGGMYEATVQSCVNADIPIDCTWADGSNPDRSDSISVQFQ